MATPKYIKMKAEQLERALNMVAKLSNEIEDWYGKKTDEYEACEFYCEFHLDNPWEFRLTEVLEELDSVSDR